MKLRVPQAIQKLTSTVPPPVTRGHFLTGRKLREELFGADVPTPFKFLFPRHARQRGSLPSQRGCDSCSLTESCNLGASLYLWEFKSFDSDTLEKQRSPKPKHQLCIKDRDWGCSHKD